MRVVVTGGSGFVGRELLEMLILQGYEVINIDLVPSAIQGTDRLHDLTTGSIDLEADFCFHLASAAGGLLFNQKQDVIEYNNKINENVLKSCDMPILFVSTLNVFEGCKTINDGRSPETPYAQSKLNGEQFFLHNAVNGLYIVRPSNIFGASQLSKFTAYGESHVIPDILNKINNSDVIDVWGNGTQKRNFLHVKDICRYLMSFLQQEHDPENNICSSITLSIMDLVKCLLEFKKTDMPIHYNSSYMQYEKMFIEDIIDELYNVGTIKSIAEGLVI